MPLYQPDHQVSPMISILPNLLSDRPRQPPPFFDEDGPGHRSEDGPRHDNDFAMIRDIQILPTIDEILSIRPIYMPKKNIDRPHFLEEGPSRLLDTHFRQLRYDSTASIRDICYHAAQQVYLHDKFRTKDDLPYQETTSNNRYQLYTGIEIEELIAHERKGMIVRISFECPPSLRGPRIHKSTRLATGMLCALMSMDLETQELVIVYFDIHQRQSTISMQSRGTGHRRAAVQLSFHEDAKHADILHVTQQALGLRPASKLILIEFPKVLYAGFYHPLRRLQQMTAQDFAFNKYLQPHLPFISGGYQGSSVHIDVPQYTQERHFEYDLSSLMNNGSSKKDVRQFIGPGLPDTMKYLRENTSLDEGQAVALCDSLSRELSFIQGPPGTGKTFLGIALARVLLASRPESRAKPILVVCLTNHALDTFLAGLRDSGVEKLIRIGSGSREEWTKSINIEVRSKKQRLSRNETGDLRGIHSQRKHTFGELASWCTGVSRQIASGLPNWHHIAPLLKRQYTHVYSQLVTGVSRIEVQSFVFDYWAVGGDLDEIRSFRKEMSSRLFQADSSRAKDEQELVEELLENISTHVKEERQKAGETDIWHLPSFERQHLLAE